MQIEQSGIPKLVSVIIPAGSARRFENLLSERGFRYSLLISARGTALSEALDIVGLDATDKMIFVCAVPYAEVNGMLTAVIERFEMKKEGNGIAFVLPVSAMSAAAALSVAGEAAQNENDGASKGGIKKMASSGFELIMGIINHGFSDELMEAARESGARGGTVFAARGTARAEDEKFYGIAIQPEKEIVAIIAPRNIRKAIMEGISRACGSGTKAAGVFVSVPVEQVAGIGVN